MSQTRYEQCLDAAIEESEYDDWLEIPYSKEIAIHTRATELFAMGFATMIDDNSWTQLTDGSWLNQKTYDKLSASELLTLYNTNP